MFPNRFLNWVGSTQPASALRTLGNNGCVAGIRLHETLLAHIFSWHGFADTHVLKAQQKGAFTVANLLNGASTGGTLWLHVQLMDFLDFKINDFSLALLARSKNALSSSNNNNRLSVCAVMTYGP